MQECHVLAPELFALVGPLRRLLGRLKLRRRAEVQLTLIDGGVDVVLGGVVAEGLAAAEALTAFAARVQGALETGHFAVEPDADGTACEYCAFDLVCRKGPRLERKRAEASRDL